MTEPLSPCLSVCRLDASERWCVGCGRTLAEIARWPAASAEEKAAILRKLPSRLAAMARPQHQPAEPR